jgi:hypothetical protein
MTSPTRFPNGLGTVESWRALGDYPLPDPAHTSGSTIQNANAGTSFGVSQFFLDFLQTADTTAYTVSGVGTPASALGGGYPGTTPTIGGGSWVLTTTTGAADSTIALGNSTPFAYVSGQKAWYLTSFQLSDATTCAIVAGLKDAVSESNGIWFSKASASMSVSLNIKVATVATAYTAITTLANNTTVQLGWHYDGVDLHVFVNDSMVLTVSAASLPTTLLASIFSITNGSGVARTMAIDYVLASGEVQR